MVNYHNAMRRAFTLIEILVVVLIISIIAALLLAGAGMIRESAEVLSCKQRMEQIQQGLQENSAADSEAMQERLQMAITGQVRKWDSLKNIIDTLRKDHNLKLTSSVECRKYLPPGLLTIYDSRIGCYQEFKDKNTAPEDIEEHRGWIPMNIDPRDGLWNGARSSYNLVGKLTLDRILVWWNFMDFSHGNPFWDRGQLSNQHNRLPAHAQATPMYKSAGRQTYHWWHKDIPERRPVADTNNGGQADRSSARNRYAWLVQRKSPLQENLSRTVEIVPDDKREKNWYREAWPILSERIHTDDDGNDVYIQRAWPDSDWNEAVPGVNPPLWEMPWGREIISRKTGGQVSQFLQRDVDDEGRTLADCSPLASMQILQLAGVLEDGEEGIKDFRTNRNREMPFNDYWGNPLIVASAMYIAPRYYLDPQQLLKEGFASDPQAKAQDASHGYVREFFNDLHGGRDFLRTRAMQSFDSPIISYCAVGAIGPDRDVFGDYNEIEASLPDWVGTNALRWAEDADGDKVPLDDLVLRAAWLQISEICTAEDWDDQAFVDPVWNGIRKSEDDTFLCLLGRPIALQ